VCHSRGESNDDSSMAVHGRATSQGRLASRTSEGATLGVYIGQPDSKTESERQARQFSVRITTGDWVLGQTSRIPVKVKF